MFLIEIVLFVILAMVMRQSEIGFTAPLSSLPWWLWVFAISLCSTIGPFLLILHWQKFVTMTEAGMIYGLTPVFTLICGLFLPALLMRWTGVPFENETVTKVFLIGAMLVVAANVVMQLFHVVPPKIAGRPAVRSAGPKC